MMSEEEEEVEKRKSKGEGSVRDELRRVLYSKLGISVEEENKEEEDVVLKSVLDHIVNALFPKYR